MTTSARADAPFRRSGTFGRRTMLGGMGAVGLAAALGQPALSTPLASAAPVRLGDGSTPGQPVPFYLQASSELSEDYFLTDRVLVGAGDRVLPFVNPGNSGAVEAVVLAGRAVHHLRRDPGATTGWTYESIDTTPPFAGLDAGVADAAVQTAADGTVLLACRQTQDGSPVLAFYTVDGSGGWSWLEGAVRSVEVDPTPLTAGVTPDGFVYFTMVDATGQITIWVHAAAGVQVVSPASLQLEGVVDALVLWNPDRPAASAPGAALVLTDDHELHYYVQLPNGDFSTVQDTYPDVVALVWAGPNPDPTVLDPLMVFQDSRGQLMYVSQGSDGIFALVQDYGDTAGPGRAAVWRDGDLYGFAFLDADLVEVVLQTGAGATDDDFQGPLPLQGGLERIYALSSAAQGATLFAVGTDESLSVLTLDASGWTSTGVQQDGATLQEVTSYRVKIDILDQNGVGVLGGTVRVGTDRPVGLWQASGSTLLTPLAPVTLTADLMGAVTFSMPAEEMDAAVLTVQALDPDGKPTGQPLVVTPDTDVRGFLGGTGSLASVGVLDPATLLRATNADGSALLPVLTSLPGDQQQQAAASVGSALNSFIAVGAGATPAQVGAASMQLDLDGGAPVFQKSADPAAHRAARSDREVESSFSHVFDSIGHALRHAAVVMTRAVVRWVDDAAQWVVDVTVTIGEFTDLVITDMKDAFHVIGGFFHALGADIEKAVAWLKHNVIELLREAGANAALIEGWLTKAPDEFSALVKGIEKATDGWFAEQQENVDAMLADAAKTVEDATFGSSTPIPPPSDDTGSSGRQSALVKDLGHLTAVLHDAPGMWLLDKLLDHLPADPGPELTDVFSPVIDDLATDFDDAVGLAESVRTLITTTAKDAFGSKQQITATKVSDWFGDLQGSVDKLLQLADAIADTVLDLGIATLGELGEYLSYEYHLVSTSSLIGLILDAAGLDPKLSLDHLLSLVVAYPATLIGRIRGYSSLFPPAATPAQLRGGHRAALGKAPDGWQTGLGLCAAVAQGVWGFGDLVGDLQSMVDPETGERGTPSGLIDYIDIICPILETVFLWPGKTKPDGSTSYPFDGGLATDTTDWGLLPPTIYSALIPSLFAIATKMKSKTAGTGGTAALPKGVKDPYDDYFAPIVAMGSGIANTALSCAYSARNDAGGVAIAGTALGNVSFILAPLETWWMNATTADVPVLIKTAVDAVGNIGAAICIAESSSLPPR